MLTGGRHPHTETLWLCFCGKPRSKEKLPSGARSASSQRRRRFPGSVYLVARANQERTVDNSTAHTSVDGLTVLEFPTAHKSSL